MNPNTFQELRDAVAKVAALEAEIESYKAVNGYEVAKVTVQKVAEMEAEIEALMTKLPIGGKTSTKKASKAKRVTGVAEKILDAIGGIDSGAYVSADTLAEMTGIDVVKVKASLSYLTRKKKVVNVGDGGYRLPVAA